MKKNTILHTIAKLVVPLKRTVSPLEADSHSACGGHFFNRSLFLLLLMLILGVTGIKAQDYSGTYYIGSYGKDDKDHIGYTVGSTETNYYLCPTEDWIYYEYKNNKDDYTLTPNGQPFITSYQVKSTSKEYDATKAEWVITKHSSLEYYYIQQRKTGKYLVFNGQINTSKANRIRAHLEGGVESYAPTEYALFEITTNPANSYLNGAYLFHPKKASAGYYLNISEGNQDALIGTNAKTDGPTASDFTKYVGGTLGQWNEANNTSSYRFEDVIPAPIITQQNDNKITITYPGTETVTLYYTTNGDRPDPENVGGDNPTQIYTPGTTTISMTNSVTTVKAVAVKAASADEVLDTYSRCVTLTTQRYIGSSYPYMIQNVECTDFYMIPGDVNSNNTEVNTSSLFRSTMVWTFFNAGSDPGVQYYYIKNGTSYLYHKSDGSVYMKTSGDFSDSDDGYKFSIEQGYKAENDPDGFHIVPKAKSSDNTYCIYKGGWGNTTPPTIANSKADVMKGSTNARRYEQKHTRWNFISAPGGVLPSLLTYDSSNSSDPNWPAFLSSSTATNYFKIENVGTAGRYICPPTGEAAVGTATTGDNELAWYVIEAGHDDWRKYYFIVHASTGKYLKFNQTIADPPSSMSGKNSVLSLLDYDSSASDRYQFVFAKSTVDGAYYIVPKGLEDATYNSYYALYLDASDASTLEQPIKSTNNRLSDSYKWKFVAADLFCNDPAFEESEGNITISCTTNAAKIYYTDDGDTPDANSTLYNPESINWLSTGQHLIKAIAVVSDGSNTSSSSVVTLLNKPDITLVEDETPVDENTYTYDGTAKTPDVEVSITKGSTTFTAPTTPATYTVTYSNNTNARTETSIPTVSIADAAEDDLWYIWNAEAVDFNIKPASVTLTANSRNTDVYNGSEKTVTGFTSSVDGLTFAESVSASGSGTNVGEYDVTFSGVTLNTTRDNANNYVVTGTTNGTLTINAKAVTITADDASKEYDGNPLTSDDFTATDLEEGDTHTFTVVMTAESTITNVGSTDNEIATVDGTAVTTGVEMAVGNYLVTTAKGTLTINKKTLTITADSDTKVYDGTALTKDSYTSDGLMTGDNIESVTITGSQTTVGTGDNVPSAAVVKKGETNVTESYAITYVYGTLTITPAAVTVTADSKTKTYGEANPDLTLTATVEGMVNNESPTLITYSLSRAEGDDVGEYTITPTGDAEQGNYSVSYVTGTLTVNQKEVGITWTHTDDLVYNGSSQTPTATATGLVGSDEIGVTVTGGGINAGTYNATASGLTGDKAGNYKLPDPVPPQSFTISKAPLVAVNLSETELAYNGTEQTVTITSVTAGEGGALDVPDTDYEISSGSLSGTNASTYTVTVSSNSTNYTGSVEASFIIGAKAIGDETNHILTSDFSVEIGANNALILKDGETTLTAGEDGDYTIGEPQTSTSGRYSTRTITGTGNYKSSAVIRNAIVNFTTDDSGLEWAATFVAENASETSPDATKGHALPDGVKAYIITSIEGDNANTVELNYIPEGVPVVLVSDKAYHGFVVENANPTEEQKITDSQKTANMLKEVTETTTGYVSDTESPYYQTVHFDVAKIYLLYKNEFVLNKEGYLAKGNVYMNKPAAAPARLKISKGDNTGIENIEYTIDSQSGAWYTLDGRRLSSKPTKKGLYLQGGKKVVIK